MGGREERRGFVKICGVTSEEDALLAVALGADAVGFIFAPSKRQIAPQIAADIIKRLPRDEVITVGVFRDEAPQRVSDVAVHAGLHAVQLHGHEPPETARWLGTRIPKVIQAFPAGDRRVRQAGEYGAYAVLLDAPDPGSGQRFDWSLAAEVPPGQRLIVAGGLDAGNVEAAIAGTGCWGVDVASGVEKAPGRKDPIRLREFIAAARAGFTLREETERDGPPPGRSTAAGLYDWQEDM
ncbi:MAG TPA: phosphoribosylanthranilate isomerase [Acidimicrobiales bacterium]|nr:phosphoribosylanthranilate isomerase [Acidimicrobiales bacterium]